MTNYQVTIGYRAIIQIDVKAETEEEAKKKAVNLFTERERSKWFQRKDIMLSDDNYGADGVMNLDNTWNMVY